MGFRVTPSILFRTSLGDVTRQRLALQQTQERAATGRVINRPSDDPAGTGAVLLLRAGIGSIEQFQRNGASAKARIAAAEQTLSGSFDLLVRARELAIQGANETQSAASRLQIAREVEGLHGSLVSEANARLGSFLFSGLTGDVAPFTLAGVFSTTPPASPTVSFAGDSTSPEVQIDDRERVPVAFDGRRVFLGDANGDGTTDAGREDLFDVLADLHDALATNDRVATGATLSRIDRAMDQLNEERTELGTFGSRIETTEQRLLDRELAYEGRISQIEDADLAEVISDLTQQESALQAGLSAMARLLQPTLLNFLN